MKNSVLTITDTTLYFAMNYQDTRVKNMGWLSKFNKKLIAMDIDLSCFSFDEAGNCIDKVWFKQLRNESESIKLHGDQLRGRREHKETNAILTLADLERIEIKLNTLSSKIKHIALVVSSFTKHPLSKVISGSVYLQDDDANYLLKQELTMLPDNQHSSLVAIISRVDLLSDNWQIEKKQIDITEDINKNIGAVAEFIGCQLNKLPVN